MKRITLRTIFLRFKWRISFTMLLVIAESLLGILFPLLIGIAINDLLDDKYTGLYCLAGLGALSLVIGSARRFYDTRIFSNIYRKVTVELVDRENEKNSSVSKISARTGLMTEMVEFLENYMPAVIEGIIGLVGIIIIIATLNLNVFYACIGVLALVILIYVITGDLHFNLNAGYNDQLEKQVEVLETKDRSIVKKHFSSIMRWNIKLSDLETANYFFIWLGMIALIVYTPITVIESGIIKYGLVFSILMYVFDCIEKLVTMPLFIQQVIRLSEISRRFDD